MYVRAQDGKWYEVDDKSLKGKEIDAEKVKQVIADANAETRKKAAELLASLDPEVAAALQAIVAGSISAGRPGQFPGGTDAIGWTADCWTAECWTAECIDFMEGANVQPPVRRGGVTPQQMQMMQMRQPSRYTGMPQMPQGFRPPMEGPQSLDCWTADCWTADCWTADCIDWMQNPNMGNTGYPVRQPMPRRRTY